MHECHPLRCGGGSAVSNTLYYGDNLNVLRDSIASESVDLVYLDPPFNSQANYNILFKSPTGARSQAQIEAFEDTWHWSHEAEDAYDQVTQKPINLRGRLFGSLMIHHMSDRTTAKWMKRVGVFTGTTSLVQEAQPEAILTMKFLVCQAIGGTAKSVWLSWWLMAWLRFRAKGPSQD